MKSGRRRSGFGAVLMLITGMMSSQSRSIAAMPDRSASDAYAIEVQLAPDVSRIFLVCSSEGQTTVFLGASITDPDGSPAVQGAVKVDTMTDSSITHRSGPNVDTYEIAEGAEEGFSYGIEIPPVPGGFLRGAWARWGSRARCDIALVRIDGSLKILAFETIDPAQAVYALNTDFENGEAASMKTCAHPFEGKGYPLFLAGGCAKAGVALDGVYRRSSTGFLFALLSPGNVGAARTRIQGPEGQQRDGSGTCSSITPCSQFVSEPTNGEWMYSLDIQGTTDGGPVLWIVAVPAP